MKQINVLIVDDSAIVRKVLTENLSKYKDINIIGTAIDPYIARDKIVALKNVDVLLLDIEMPRMDGLTFLKYLMKSYPLPVIIVSSITKDRNDAALKALELGAVDIVPKPGGPFSVGEIIESLVEKIRCACRIELAKVKINVEQAEEKTKDRGKRLLSKIITTKKLIAVGASTGGTSALETLFMDFDKSFPPTLAVIHMPEKFTNTFANRLNSLCPVNVKEAVNNEIALDGHIYIAPGGNSHMMIKSSGANQIIKIVNGPKYNNHRPSVDVLFKSVAENIGKNSYGILLTGMGKDGAEGLLDIRNEGGYTIAQDEASSIVFGMPREAIELNAVCDVLPLNKIANKVADKLVRG